MKLSDAGKAEVAAYHDRRRIRAPSEQRLSAGSWNRIMTVLTGFYQHLPDEGRIDRPPFSFRGARQPTRKVGLAVANKFCIGPCGRLLALAGNTSPLMRRFCFSQRRPPRPTSASSTPAADTAAPVAKIFARHGEPQTALSRRPEVFLPPGTSSPQKVRRSNSEHRSTTGAAGSISVGHDAVHKIRRSLAYELTGTVTRGPELWVK